MDTTNFENLREEFLSKESELLEYKRGEYAGEGDRLLNFKQISAMFPYCFTPADVCLTYLLKHVQGIALCVGNRDYKKWFWQKDNREGLKQRIADARNYLLLLAACIEEEVNNDA